MRLESIGSVIAERTLQGECNGSACAVVVRFGKPVKDADGCWRCPFSVSSPKGELLRYGAGLDSLQALTIAMSVAGVELSTLYTDLNLKWCGEDDLGFPSAVGRSG